MSGIPSGKPGGTRARRAIDVLADNALRFIAVTGGILVLFFSFLQLKDIPYGAIVEGTNPQHLREIVLALYYLCWVSGTTFDVAMQRRVYIRDPQGGHMPKLAFGAVGMLIVVAGILLWVKDADDKFAVALAAFLVVNIIGWRVLLSRVRPVIRESEATYRSEGNYFALEQLRVVERYIAGLWQWLRFGCMAVAVGCALAVALSGDARVATAALLHRVVSDISQAAIARLLPVVALALFVLVAETWIWIMRASVKATLTAIEHLEAGYTLRPKPTVGPEGAA